METSATNSRMESSASVLEPSRPPRRMPVWLSVALIVVALGAAGWIIAWFVQSARQTEELVLDRDPGDTVSEVGINHNAWRVKAGDFYLTISGRDHPRLDASFSRYEGLTAEQLHWLTMAKRIAGDRTVRSMLKLNAEQLDRLKQIREGSKIELSQSDKARLEAGLKTYLKESDTPEPKTRDKAETRFINVVQEVAAPISLAAQKLAMERAEMAKSLLTPDQLQIYQGLGQ